MSSRLTRRTFGACCGAMAGGLIIPTASSGQEITFSGAHRDFHPCLDVDPALIPDSVTNFDDPYSKAQIPVRSTKNDQLTPTDLALIERDETDKGASAALARELSANPEEASARSAAPQGRDAAVAAGLPGSGPARLAFETKWPTGSKLKVYFYNRPSTQVVSGILDIANIWGQFGKISFTSHPDRQAADLRVGFANTGHWSYIGTVNEGQGGQTMNLQIGTTVPRPGEYNYGVILHEFGHALGAIHEHQQPNANELFNEAEVIRYFNQQYQWSEDKTRINVLNRYQGTKLLRFSEFDRLSVMLYSYPARLTRNGQGTPVNSTLSPTDKQYFSKIYDGPTIVSPGEPDKPSPSLATKRLEIDGDLAEGHLTPADQVHRYEFEAKGTGSTFLRTLGYTEVDVMVFKEGNDKEIEPKKRLTPDLVNIEAEHLLDPGKYRVEVRHVYGGGVGKYGIKLTSKRPD